MGWREQYYKKHGRSPTSTTPLLPAIPTSRKQHRDALKTKYETGPANLSVNRNWKVQAKAESPERAFIDQLREDSSTKGAVLQLGKFNEYRVRVILEELVRTGAITGFSPQAPDCFDILRDAYIDRTHRDLHKADSEIFDLDKAKIDTVVFKKVGDMFECLALQIKSSTNQSGRLNGIFCNNTERVPFHSRAIKLSMAHSNGDPYTKTHIRGPGLFYCLVKLGFIKIGHRK